MSNSKMFVPGAALDGLRLALEAENKKLRAEVRSLLEHRHLADFYARDATNARVEADKLRARVAVLREPLAVYVHAHQTGNSVPPHIEAAARAALEAKP